MPVRTCLGCMGRDAQAVMIRLIALPGEVTVADGSGQGGRGGYIHRSNACLERFERSRIKEFRSLRRRLGGDERRAITEQVRKRLASEGRVE
jgi:predicted RNA-binding protein YlxR (DUF448 family)